MIPRIVGYLRTSLIYAHLIDVRRVLRFYKVVAEDEAMKLMKTLFRKVRMPQGISAGFPPSV